MSQTETVSIERLCHCFGYSKQAYYQRLHHQYQQVQDRQLVLAAVHQWRHQLPTIGTLKLHHLLQQEGLYMGRDALFDLLREEKLLILTKRKYVKTTDSRGWMRQYPDLAKELMVSRPEELLVADITYLHTQAGVLYLHLLSDAYSKKIMGYELSDNLLASSSLKALQMALANRQYAEPIIHHSDRGLQYVSKLYTDVLKANKWLISTTQDGSPYENAIAERINGILKTEFGLGELLDSVEQAKQLVVESIGLYNQLRPHLSCEFLTPNQMHQQHSVKIKTYKTKKSELVSAPILTKTKP